jgi:hypothetical protein
MIADYAPHIHAFLLDLGRSGAADLNTSAALA